MSSNYILFGYNQFATRLEGLRLNLISAIADKLAKLGGFIDFGGWATFDFDKPGRYGEYSEGIVISGISTDAEGRPTFYLAPGLLYDECEECNAPLQRLCDFDNLLEVCRRVTALNGLEEVYRAKGEALKDEFVAHVKEVLGCNGQKRMLLTERQNLCSSDDFDYNLAQKYEFEEDYLHEIALDGDGEVIIHYTDLMSDDEDEVRSCNLSLLKWNQIEKLAFIYFYLDLVPGAEPDSVESKTSALL